LKFKLYCRLEKEMTTTHATDKEREEV